MSFTVEDKKLWKELQDQHPKYNIWELADLYLASFPEHFIIIKVGNDCRDKHFIGDISTLKSSCGCMFLSSNTSREFNILGENL